MRICETRSCLGMKGSSSPLIESHGHAQEPFGDRFELAIHQLKWWPYQANLEVCIRIIPVHDEVVLGELIRQCVRQRNVVQRVGDGHVEASGNSIHGQAPRQSRVAHGTAGTTHGPYSH